MTRDLAVAADSNVALDFNKGADAAAIPDVTPVKVHQIRLIDDNTLSQFYVVSNHAFRFRLFMNRNAEKHFSGQRES